MLCLGRRPGEGIVIDNQYLLVVEGEYSSGIMTKLYKNKSNDEPQSIELNLKEPYSITSNIHVTFLGWKKLGNYMSEFASLGISAPRSINIVRCELIKESKE